MAVNFRRDPSPLPLLTRTTVPHVMSFKFPHQHLLHNQEENFLPEASWEPQPDSVVPCSNSDRWCEDISLCYSAVNRTFRHCSTSSTQLERSSAANSPLLLIACSPPEPSNMQASLISDSSHPALSLIELVTSGKGLISVVSTRRHKSRRGRSSCPA